MRKLTLFLTFTGLTMIVTCVLLVMVQVQTHETLQQTLAELVAPEDMKGMQQVRRRVGLTLTHEMYRPVATSAEQWAWQFEQLVLGDPDHTTCWVSGDAEFEIRTFCDVGETATACEARHDEAVEEMQARFPDEGECE